MVPTLQSQVRIQLSQPGCIRVSNEVVEIGRLALVVVEAILVWHRYLAERFLCQNEAIADDVVAEKKIGDDGIELVSAQRLNVAIRLGPPDIVQDGPDNGYL